MIPRVIGLSGSPRRGGNTETLLDEALKGASSAGASASKIILNELIFRPCQGCGGCDRTGRCVMIDDMDAVYEEVLSADGIIVASPLYFAGVSAQLKMMVDRFQCEWVRRLKLGIAEPRAARGVFLCVAGSDAQEHFACAQKAVRAFFKTVGAEWAGDLFFAGVEEKGAIAGRTEALAEAFKLGAIAAGRRDDGPKL